ncbi:MAG: hypothetical protein Ct9H300mP21_11040 [Pseudomonadota bacterium]|nr:MAG: hypothetical protein Ct9H300mP21_11040 [Pseudomonadota bacterium]
MRDNDSTKKVGVSEYSLGLTHRIENPYVDLSFIEIQTGDYFGEDDIERLEDDYGRS